MIDLAAENAKLLATRRQYQQNKPAPTGPALVDAAPKTAVTTPGPSWSMVNAQATLAERRQETPAGRGCLGLVAQETAVTIPTQTQTPQTPTGPALPDLAGETAVNQTVRVWPALSAALAAKQLTPHYRLYLAACSIDPDGRRVFDLPDLRQFTDKNGRYYLFSWRRMRQVVGQGEGILWTRHGDRLVFHGVARLAAAAGLTRIGRGVELETRHVFAGQGEFAAHLHAAWLAAHTNGRPVSQAVIEQQTAVPARSQRRYNRVANVQRRGNLEIGSPVTPEAKENAAWANGHNSFVFHDRDGRRGKPGGRYQARRLPDSYERRHALAANGRKRKINKAINGLVIHEERGSGDRPDQRYFDNGNQAAKAANRRPDHPVYWQSGSPAGRWSIWHGLVF